MPIFMAKRMVFIQAKLQHSIFIILYLINKILSIADIKKVHKYGNMQIKK